MEHLSSFSIIRLLSMYLNVEVLIEDDRVLMVQLRPKIAFGKWASTTKLDTNGRVKFWSPT